MNGALRALVWHAAILILTVSGLEAQAIIEPPFGLHWGDSPEKLIEWAGRHSLDVTISLPGDQPAVRVLRIQPRKGFLPGSQAAALEARFLGGKLFELAVHYFDPAVPADTISARFEQMRKQLTAQHGPFIANREQRTVEDKFAVKTLAFHREPVKGLFLLLAFTEVEDLLRESREARFSLVYRNDNYKAEVQKALTEASRKKP